MADSTIELLRLSMNVSRAQQQAHMENIAGYTGNAQQVRSIDFSQVMSELSGLDQTAKQQYAASLLSDWQSILTQHTSTQLENVSLDNEVAKMTLVASSYQRSAELINRKLAMMQLVISGGKR